MPPERRHRGLHRALKRRRRIADLAARDGRAGWDQPLSHGASPSVCSPEAGPIRPATRAGPRRLNPVQVGYSDPRCRHRSGPSGRWVHGLMKGRHHLPTEECRASSTSAIHRARRVACLPRCRSSQRAVDATELLLPTEHMKHTDKVVAWLRFIGSQKITFLPTLIDGHAQMRRAAPSVAPHAARTRRCPAAGTGRVRERDRGRRPDEPWHGAPPDR
jgi:hypothetical protein